MMPANSSGAPNGAWIGALMLLGLPSAGGCNRSGLEKIPLAGTVTISGELVPDGEIRFVPIAGTPGPVTAGNIVGGQYEVNARGGVPVGKHRVEIRIVGAPPTPSPGQGEVLANGATSSVGPPIYDSAQSPLTANVSRQTDRRLDFAIP